MRQQARISDYQSYTQSQEYVEDIAKSDMTMRLYLRKNLKNMRMTDEKGALPERSSRIRLLFAL